MNLFENISVNVATGSISYPKLEGFELDTERMYRSVERFLPHCNGSVEMAVKHAIHEQLSAHKGLQGIVNLTKKP